MRAKRDSCEQRLFTPPAVNRWALAECQARREMQRALCFWMLATPAQNPGFGELVALTARAASAASAAVGAAKNLPEVEEQQMRDLQVTASDKLGTLQKDNDSVYFESVPPEASLPLATGKVPEPTLPYPTVPKPTLARRGARRRGVGGGPAPPAPPGGRPRRGGGRDLPYLQSTEPSVGSVSWVVR